MHYILNCHEREQVTLLGRHIRSHVKERSIQHHVHVFPSDQRSQLGARNVPTRRMVELLFGYGVEGHQAIEDAHIPSLD